MQAFQESAADAGTTLIKVRILDHQRSIGKVWQETKRDEGQRMQSQAVGSACTQRVKEGKCAQQRHGGLLGRVSGYSFGVRSLVQ
jgi:hypothetical protein